MAKTHIFNYEPDRIGGGWKISKYLYEGLNCVSYEESDNILITGPTMISYEQFDKAKRDGKKIVLRIDNHLLPSRNRNTGMSRMQYFAENSDLCIFQSEWAYGYLSAIIKRGGAVILNGVDTSIFNKENRTENEDYLYLRSSRINEKGWELSRYEYSLRWLMSQDMNLNIVGKFSGENLEYNFDFFNGERFKFWGEQPHDMIAQIMKQSKYYLYSHFIEACSNSLLEARACGMIIIDVFGALKTGSAPEIMELKDLSKERMIKEYSEAINVL